MAFLVKVIDSGETEGAKYITPSGKDILLDKLLDIKLKKGITLREFLRKIFGDDPVVGEIEFFVIDPATLDYTKGKATIIENTLSDIYVNKLLENDYLVLVPLTVEALDYTEPFEIDYNIVPIGVRKKIDKEKVINFIKEKLVKPQQVVATASESHSTSASQTKPQVTPSQLKGTSVDTVLKQMGYVTISSNGLAIGKKTIFGTPFYVVVYEGNLSENEIASFLGKLALLNIEPNIKIFVANQMNEKAEILIKKGVIVINSHKELETLLYSVSNAREKIEMYRKTLAIVNSKVDALEKEVGDIKKLIRDLLTK